MSEKNTNDNENSSSQSSGEKAPAPKDPVKELAKQFAATHKSMDKLLEMLRASPYDATRDTVVSSSVYLGEAHRRFEVEETVRKGEEAKAQLRAMSPGS